MFDERSDRPDEGGDPDVTELNRRVANLIRVGVIAETDYPRALARLRIGDLLTDWRPWLAPRAGGDSGWWAPEIGEQAVLISPSGELAQGVILVGLYQRDKPAPANRETVHRVVYKDGAVFQYDRASGVYSIVLPPGGKFRFVVGASSLEIDTEGWTVATPDAAWTMG